jgi:CxxC-x17-CxxC domain-containing protein
MDFQDRTLQCLDCKNDFVFTAGEQSFYERKGFREIPKRCKPCRDARKSRRGPRDDAQDGYGNGYGHSSGANGNGGGNGYANGNGNGNGYAKSSRPSPAPYGEWNGDGNSYGGGNGYGASREESRGNRAPREMFDATCASCGAAAQVPFRPASGRPVYCKECYASRQGQGSAYGDE